MAEKAYRGKAVTVTYDPGRCRHFAECVRGLPQVFDTTKRPWVNVDAAAAEQVAEVVRRCPSGALHAIFADGSTEVPEQPSRVRVLAGGPVLLRGDLLIDTPAGPRHELRAAICGCHRSAASPWCDGTCEHGGPAPA